MAEEVGKEQLDVGEDLFAFALLSICYTFPEELSEGQLEKNRENHLKLTSTSDSKVV